MQNRLAYIIAAGLFFTLFLNTGFCIELGPSLTSLNVSRSILFITDPENRQTFDSIQKETEWQKNRDSSIALGYPRGAVWFKIDYTRIDPVNDNHFLELSFPPLDYIDMYIPLQDGSYRIIKTGDQRGFSSRDYYYVNPVFSLQGSAERGTIYFKIRMDGSLRFTATIYSQAGLQKQMTTHLAMIWLFFGGLLVLIMLNATLLFVRPGKTYLYFALFVASTATHQIAIHGLGHQYLWPESSFSANLVLPVAISLIVVFFVLFINKILGLRNLSVPVSTAFLVMVAGPQAILALASPFISVRIHMIIGLMHILIITIPGILTVIIYGLYKKIRYSWFLLAGYLMLAGGVIVPALTALGIINLTIVSQWGTDAGMILFLNILTIGLIDQIITMKNQLAQSETKVRTQLEELNATYEELQATNEELESINNELISNQDLLVKREEMITLLLDTYPNCVYVIDSEENFLVINKAMAEMLGLGQESILKTNRSSLIDSGNISHDTVQRFRELEESTRIMNKPLTAEIDTIFANGKNRVLMVVLVPFDHDKNGDGLLCVGVDVTDRRALEKNLEQAQKMEALGTLASSIAHDFNNIIQAIMGNTQFMKKSFDENSKNSNHFENMENIEQACRSASELVSQLLMLGRTQDISKSELSLNALIRDNMRLIERVIPEEISLTTKLDPLDPIIIGEKTRLDQVIINLLINARDAIEGEGTITISTTIKDNTRVLLTVTDTGIGMSDDLKERIFEPFFTTKPEGKGSGLGLAMIYGIIQSHNGTIECHTAPGQGTGFEISFPFVNNASKPIQKEQ